MRRTKRLPQGTPLFAQVVSPTDPLAIAGFRAWRLREPDSGRSWTVVKLQARNGASGYGEGGPSQLPAITAARDAILGRRATALEFARARLAATPALEAAVGNAMIDLMARHTKVPAYQWLGGPVRFKARALAHLDGPELQADSLAKAAQRGYRAFVLPVPPREPMSRLQAWVDLVRGRVDQFKRMAGPDADFVLDGGGVLLPGDGASIARALERAHPIWFDEPAGILTSEALAKITDESVMPVGFGRGIHDIPQFQNLLRWGAADVLRPSLGANSVHKIKRIAAIAETHYVAVAPHHNGGPLGTAQGMHFGAAVSNFYIQQVPVPRSARDAAMRSEIAGPAAETAVDGFAQLGNQPGWGLDINEAALDRYSEEKV